MEYSDEAESQVPCHIHAWFGCFVGLAFPNRITILTSCSASCATVVRLGYLTLYNDPTEFVYSTGAIGLWSILEEGIGIIAGSMPALRPLLNLSIFGKSTYASGGASNQASSHMHLDHMSNKRTHNQLGDMEMNDFQGNFTTRVSRGQEEKHSLDDSDSQKFILKSTKVVMTTEQA